jgi:hypothetical protein
MSSKSKKKNKKLRNRMARQVLSGKVTVGEARAKLGRNITQKSAGPALTKAESARPTWPAQPRYADDDEYIRAAFRIPHSGVERLGDVEGDDRHRDSHPDVVATPPDLRIDVGGDDRRAFLPGEAAFEVSADGSPCTPAAAARHAEADEVAPAIPPDDHASRHPQRGAGDTTWADAL